MAAIHAGPLYVCVGMCLCLRHQNCRIGCTWCLLLGGTLIHAPAAAAVGSICRHGAACVLCCAMIWCFDRWHMISAVAQPSMAGITRQFHDSRCKCGCSWCSIQLFLS
jgi:hypothetical protein